MDLIEAYREIDEEKRLQSTLARRVEYLTTIRILEQYCSDKANCIDVGCGVGIYSLYMDGLGVKTTALDLVPEHIVRFNEIIKETNADITAQVGTALNLSEFKSESFEVVLCLGPLYHFITLEQQIKCVKECRRVADPNAILLFSYISPYSVFPCAIRGDINRMSLKLIDKIIDDHCIERDSPYCFWTDNDYHDPYEIEKLIADCGLKIIDHLSTDGQSIAFQNVVNKMTEKEFDIWMNYHLRTCRIRSMLGSSNHGLIVARKAKT